MKSRAVIFLFFFILNWSVIIAFAQSATIKEGTKPQRMSSPGEVSKLTEWKRFNILEGNLSILFPNTPGRHETSKQLPQGYANQYRYYWDTSDEQLYFEAQVLELSPGISFNLERGVQGFKQQYANKNAVLLSEKKIEVNGVPAIDLLYQIPDEPEPVLSYARMMSCGNRIYTLLGSGTNNQKDLFKVVTKYFDSFSPTVNCDAETSSSTETKQTRTTEPRSSTPSRRYIRGPKGGCYYINSNGNKVYVDRSLCN
jgi:hypothetical protein